MTKILVTAETNKNGNLEKSNYMYNILYPLTEEGLEMYATNWRYIKKHSISKIVEVSTGKIKQDVDLNDFDLINFRRMGKIHKELKDLEEIIINLKNNFKGEIINNPETILYGINKEYLLRLQEQGFSVPRTHKINSKQTANEIKNMFEEKRDYIIKPWDGEQGNYVIKLEELTETIIKEISRITPYVLIQEFIEGIKNGEKSLIYLGDRFSHAVIKIPKKGNFLANISNREEIRSYSPSQQEIDLGFKIIKGWPYKTGILRLDLVSNNQEPTIMEVETVNPSTYVEDIGEYKNFNQKLANFYKELLT